MPGPKPDTISVSLRATSLGCAALGAATAAGVIAAAASSTLAHRLGARMRHLRPREIRSVSLAMVDRLLPSTPHHGRERLLALSEQIDPQFAQPVARSRGRGAIVYRASASCQVPR